jgi:hypothetical protein
MMWFPLEKTKQVITPESLSPGGDFVWNGGMFLLSNGYFGTIVLRVYRESKMA